MKRRTKTKRGGFRIKLFDEWIEKYQKANLHQRDCGACVLKFMGFSDKIVKKMGILAEQKGLTMDQIQQAFKEMFPKIKNMQWSSGSSFGPLEYFLQFIKKGEGAIVLIARSGDVGGHFVIFAKTTKTATPFIIDTQGGKIYVGLDEIRPYLQETGAVDLFILNSTPLTAESSPQQSHKVTGISLPSKPTLRRVVTDTLRRRGKHTRWGNPEMKFTYDVWDNAEAGTLTKAQLESAVEAGANIEWKNPHFKDYNALSIAIENGHVDVVALLLKKIKPTFFNIKIAANAVYKNFQHGKTNEKFLQTEYIPILNSLLNNYEPKSEEEKNAMWLLKEHQDRPTTSIITLIADKPWQRAPRGGGHTSCFPHKRRMRKRQRGGNGEEDKWKAKFLESIKSQKLKAAVPTWGTPHTHTKSLSNLYKEVKEGESQIEFTDQGPIRVVNVVQMEIYPSKTKNKRLKERKHYSPDGQTVTKERDMLLSEKIQGEKEDPTAAAMRGIAEELGADHAITLLSAPQFIKEKQTHSYSYPELPTQYRYFIGKAIVKGLPDPEQHPTFKTTEYNKDRSIKRIIEWAWEDVEQSNDDTPTAAAATTADTHN